MGVLKLITGGAIVDHMMAGAPKLKNMITLSYGHDYNAYT